MTTQNPLEQRNDFKGLYFYYYLPNFNINERKKLSELIFKNLGVKFFIIKKQTITFSLQDDYWVIIEKFASLKENNFKEEILNNGGIVLYYNNKRYFKTIKNHPNKIFNCIFYEGNY